MSYTTKVISIGSLNVESGSGYRATLDQSYVQPENTIGRVQRDADSPIVTAIAPGLQLYLLSVIVVEAGLSADDLDTKRRALLGALDSSQGPITITIENQTGTARQRYMRCVVRKVDQVAQQAGRGFAAALEAADDVRWRSTTTEEIVWEISSAASRSVVNTGDLDAYPTITIKPTTGKSVPNWLYRRPVIVRWQSPYGGYHPIDITGGGTNTAALVAGGKVANGTNMAVWLNGRYVPFWYGGEDGQPGGFNSTTTKIWINLYALPKTEIQTAEFISETATTWRVRNDAGLPASGILDVAGSEIVSYSSRSSGYLYGVQRGLYGTTPIEYNANLTATIIPAVGYILYGPNGAVPAAQQDFSYRNATRPLMTAGSSNSTWIYPAFHESTRAVPWNYHSHLNSLGFVTDSDITGYFNTTWAEPWASMGIKSGWTGTSGFSTRYAVPVAQMVVNGRHMARGSATQSPNSPRLMAYDDHGANEHILWNSNAGVSQTLNTAVSLTCNLPTTAHYTVFFWGVSGGSYIQANIGLMNITFVSDYLPQIEVGTEDTDYDLDMEISNSTTDEYFIAEFPNMIPGKGLIIDSENQTVIYDRDNSNQYAAVRMYPIRPRFMRLVPGTNTIHVSETGMGSVTITFRYEPRWYT